MWLLLVKLRTPVPLVCPPPRVPPHSLPLLLPRFPGPVARAASRTADVVPGVSAPCSHGNFLQISAAALLGFNLLLKMVLSGSYPRGSDIRFCIKETLLSLQRPPDPQKARLLSQSGVPAQLSLTPQEHLLPWTGQPQCGSAHPEN